MKKMNLRLGGVILPSQEEPDRAELVVVEDIERAGRRMIGITSARTFPFSVSGCEEMCGLCFRDFIHFAEHYLFFEVELAFSHIWIPGFTVPLCTVSSLRVLDACDEVISIEPWRDDEAAYSKERSG